MRSTATVCVILACVGGALSTHEGSSHAYLTQSTPPCGAFPSTVFLPNVVNQIGSKNYTTAGTANTEASVVAEFGTAGRTTSSITQLWDDIKQALTLLEQLDDHKKKYTGGLNGWTTQQHEYVIFLSKAIAGVREDDMTDEAACQQLSKDISTIYVNIEKLSDADSDRRTVTDHTDEQHTDSSVPVHKRPWKTVAAALTIAGLANTIQKY